MKKKVQGFSLIEVATASTLALLLGSAIFELQLASLSNSQQLVTRQQMVQYSDELLSQMNAQVNFKGEKGKANSLANLYLEAGYDDAKGDNRYVDIGRYTRAGTGGRDCASDVCDDSNLAQYLLNKWKTNVMEHTNMPASNVRAIICRDYRMEIPTMKDPKCDDKPGNPLALKIIWEDGNYDAESAKLAERNDNYLMYRIAGR
jgi:Tfp pilus assembly protein PilV